MFLFLNLNRFIEARAASWQLRADGLSLVHSGGVHVDHEVPSGELLFAERGVRGQHWEYREASSHGFSEKKKRIEKMVTKENYTVTVSLSNFKEWFCCLN